MTIEDVLTLTIDYVDFDDFLNRLLKTIEVTFQSSELLDFQSRLWLIYFWRLYKWLIKVWRLSKSILDFLELLKTNTYNWTKSQISILFEDSTIDL